MMKKFLSLITVTLLLALAEAEPSVADRADADKACQGKHGSAYVAKFDANDIPIGCELANANPCFYGAYVDPKTNKPGCCGAPGRVFKFDAATKNGACCDPAQIYVWNAATNTGSCQNLPPPKPPAPKALKCPEANGQQKVINGVLFSIYCNRAVRRWIPLFMYPSYVAQIKNLVRTPGVDTLEKCLENCAYDPKCQGANWINGVSCAKNIYGSGLYGNLYENPPSTDTWGLQVISFVSVPKRPGT